MSYTKTYHIYIKERIDFELLYHRGWFQFAICTGIQHTLQYCDYGYVPRLANNPYQKIGHQDDEYLIHKDSSY